MSRLLRFLLLLVCGLGLLAAVGYFGLMRMTHRWMESDLNLRAILAVTSAERSLAEHWRPKDPALVETLAAITRDERILGAAACTENDERLAATESFPDELGCRALRKFFAPQQDTSNGLSNSIFDLPAGRVHVSAIALSTGAVPLGRVILVHDLSFLGRREASVRNFLLIAFFVLALGASLITMLAARIAFRLWMADLKRALSGKPPHTFQPLLSDVRALVQRLASERNTEARVGPWTSERLRNALATHLEGERVVILANREPYIHEKTDDGVRVVHPASGLVTALEPVMRACSGVWVAHGSGSADRQTVDANNHVLVPPGEESYQIRRVWLNAAEENGYYYGLSNEGLWPLCHLAHTRPVFRAEDWEHYVRVNRKFADAVCEEVDSDDPIILVQDYHFALAPKMIRERLPRATILTFWHIPWPNAERIGICPWREEIISGLLGSSIIGFHTQQHCNNFFDAVDTFMESRIDREHNAVIQGNRRSLVRAYPISIEWPVHWLKDLPSPAECRLSIRKELGLPEDALLGVGIDRLDYTKGIEERLQAVDEMLDKHPGLRGRFRFIQLAAPSRTKIDRYRELNERVERLAMAINEKWGQGDYQPIILLRAHHEPPTVFRYYRAADLCYVSSLHDGMNLVAKEFVAARDDEQGVLVLSQFTGAARDLPEALIVNPYDLKQASEAMATALRMPKEEQRERMASMRKMVAEFNVYRWAGRMIVDAAELRRRERMSDRLSSGHALLETDLT